MGQQQLDVPIMYLTENELIEQYQDFNNKSHWKDFPKEEPPWLLSLQASFEMMNERIFVLFCSHSIVYICNLITLGHFSYGHGSM